MPPVLAGDFGEMLFLCSMLRAVVSSCIGEHLERGREELEVERVTDRGRERYKNSRLKICTVTVDFHSQ